MVLPIDNILRPRRKYAGEDLHQIALENQHKAFTIAQRIMKQSKRRQARYADMKRGKTKELKSEIQFSTLTINAKANFRTNGNLSIGS